MGRLPLLSQLTPYRLGASPTQYGDNEHRGSDPYIRRDRTDDELDRALREQWFVLVVGDSKAGKSRTAYEAARRLTDPQGERHDPAVLVPKNTAVLAKILDLDPPLEMGKPPALLWLDDLTEGELGGLSQDVLDRLRGHMLVLGTITAERYGRIEASDSEVGRPARQAAARATVIRLHSELTDTELQAARTAYPEESFESGIGEQLVAAEHLLKRYENACQGAQPHGGAVVRAAIDWVRMDVGRPIRRSELATPLPAVSPGDPSDLYPLDRPGRAAEVGLHAGGRPHRLTSTDRRRERRRRGLPAL